MKRLHTRYLFPGVVTGLFSLGLVLFFWNQGFFDTFSRSYLSLLFTLRGERNTEGIVIVDVDEFSLQSLREKWPLPRSYYSRLLQIVKEGKGGAVGFDILFLDSMDRSMDEEFARSMEGFPVVLAGKMDITRRREGNLVVEKTEVFPPLQLFRDRASWGLINLPLDRDGVIRRACLRFSLGSLELPSFATLLAKKVEVSPPEGNTPLINYAGGRGSFSYLSLSRILQGDISPRVFKDKVILVGSTLPELHDYYLTPISRFGDLPGVEVQANILHNLLTRSFLREISSGGVFWIMLVYSFLGISFSLFLGTLRSFLYFFFLSVFLLIPSFFLFVEKSFFLDITPPLLSAISTFTLTSFSLKMRILTSPWVGKYRIVEELGRGGMAIVYRALRRGRRGFVALKILHTNLAEDINFIKRFHREGETAQSLRHPRIVRILDHGEYEGKHYLAMEFLRGKGLDDYLREKRALEEGKALRIIWEVAEGLLYAHEKGVIHRDLKPGNIIITREGVKLVDFGLARNLYSEETRLTLTGTVMGTPEYMAPEQFRGEEVDGRADIYSLGVILYELLQGTPPFTGNTLGEIMKKHLYEEPDYSRINPLLVNILRKMLSKERNQRYSSVSELMEDIGKIMEEI